MGGGWSLTFQHHTETAEPQLPNSFSHQDVFGLPEADYSRRHVVVFLFFLGGGGGVGD